MEDIGNYGYTLFRTIPVSYRNQAVLIIESKIDSLILKRDYTIILYSTIELYIT